MSLDLCDWPPQQYYSTKRDDALRLWAIAESRFADSSLPMMRFDQYLPRALKLSASAIKNQKDKTAFDWLIDCLIQNSERTNAIDACNADRFGVERRNNWIGKREWMPCSAVLTQVFLQAASCARYSWQIISFLPLPQIRGPHNDEWKAIWLDYLRIWIKQPDSEWREKICAAIA